MYRCWTFLESIPDHLRIANVGFDVAKDMLN